MINNGQLLIEVLMGLLILSFLSLIVFLIFNTLPKFIQSVDESILVYNKSLNYQNILIGLSRKNFSQFEQLLINQPYYFVATSIGYEIKTGKENLGNEYYQWFIVDNNNLVNVYLQTPNNIYTFPLNLNNIREKIFTQKKWEIATSAVIDLTTNSEINQYSEKSQNIQINGQIKLSQ